MKGQPEDQIPYMSRTVSGEVVREFHMALRTYFSQGSSLLLPSEIVSIKSDHL
jgi:hypothetical protein